MRGLNELNGFCYNKILQNIIKEALRKNDNCSLQNDGLEILIIQHWHLQHQDLSFSNLLSVQRIVKYGSLLFETRTGCIPKIYKGNLQKLIFLYFVTIKPLSGSLAWWNTWEKSINFIFSKWTWGARKLQMCK